jgi:hypothetical protein
MGQTLSTYLVILRVSMLMLNFANLISVNGTGGDDCPPLHHRSHFCSMLFAVTKTEMSS